MKNDKATRVILKPTVPNTNKVDKKVHNQHAKNKVT